MFVIHLPNITLALAISLSLGISADKKARLLTLLFPATSEDPSEASVTERIGTSPAGVCTPSISHIIQ